MIASITSRATSGSPSGRTTRGPRLPPPTSTIEPGRAPRASFAGIVILAAALEQRRGGQEPALLDEHADDRPVDPAPALAGRHSIFSSERVDRDRKRLVLHRPRAIARLQLGHDPGLRDVLAARQVVAPDRQVERASVRQRLELLEDALAERALAGERGAVRVAQRARGDLRCARAAAIDEHDDRDVLVDRVALRLELALGPAPPLRRDDQCRPR